MTSPVPSAPPGAPPALLGAAAVVALQGLVLAVLGVLEIVHLQSGRATLAITTALFFLVLAAGLVACARGLFQVSSWARGPVVAVQLIGLLTAFSFWGDETTAYALGLGAACLLALVGVLHPTSTAALAASPD